jgi:uncharacterized protein YciW
MQYSWLENMTKEGSVRKEARDLIYKDCSLLLDKLGSSAAEELARVRASAAKNKSRFLEAMEGHLDSLMIGGMVAGVAGIASAIYGKISDRATLTAVIKNRAAIANSPEVGIYKEKANSRFDELVKYAPRVAAMPGLSKTIVVKSLNSGFTDRDIQYLTTLQASYSGDNREPEKKFKEYSSKLSKTSAVKTAEALADVLCIMKTAAPDKSVLRPLLHSITALTGAHILLGAGVGAVNTIRKGLEKKELEKELSHSFAEAMKQSDPTREPLHANKDKALMAFQALAHFSPAVATQPSAARAFMNSMISHDLGVPIGSIKEISDIEKNLRGSKGEHPFLEGFGKSIETTGAGSSFRGAIEHSFRSVSEHDMDAVASAMYDTNLTHRDFS